MHRVLLKTVLQEKTLFLYFHVFFFPCLLLFSVYSCPAVNTPPLCVYVSFCIFLFLDGCFAVVFVCVVERATEVGAGDILRSLLTKFLLFFCCLIVKDISTEHENSTFLFVFFLPLSFHRFLFLCC